jgi:probable DNA metabolism protein
MQTLVYDNSFAGWLTAVFEVYEYKFNDVNIVPDTQRQDSLFGVSYIVHTNEGKAARVWKGLQQRISQLGITQLYRTFLSEQKGMENTLLQYVQYAFSKKVSTEYDYSHPAVLYVVDTAKKVYREKHRMEAFVRFQQTKDNLYYAIIDPDFNVLPLIQQHFEKRYADQQWMIYDTRRKYGLYYDLHQTTTVQVDFNEAAEGGNNIAAIQDEKEPLYQQLWQQYFNSVNIKARKNTRLHIRHMPLRYWKYLPEKRPIA